MNLDSLLIALPALSPAEIHSRWNEFHSSHKDGSQQEFFKWLCESGHISELEYWDAQHGVELSFHNEEDDRQTTATSEDLEAPYHFIGKLGVGAMGEVHIVQENFLRRKVALKFIRNDRANDRSQARFVREALITAQLDHPNIVPIYNYEM